MRDEIDEIMGEDGRDGREPPKRLMEPPSWLFVVVWILLVAAMNVLLNAIGCME